MIKLTVNGKPLDANSFEGAIVESLVAHLREQLGSVRHPETGEFPTIAVTGTDLSALSCQVEGSPELLELVKKRLGELNDMKDGASSDEAGDAVEESKVPRNTLVFLSYASEDSDLAKRIADALVANGIDTWWDQWCISSGDSIRQKIDEGLGACTHFITLLTPCSISKPWVNVEIDAGFMRKLGAGIKFIALRSGLTPDKLPPLLQSSYSPEVKLEAFDVQQLVNDIYGLTLKPPLGPVPVVRAQTASSETGYSAAATALARFFVEQTEHAQTFDPTVPPEDVAATLGLSIEDLEDAVHELKGMVVNHHDLHIHPEETLFARFDKYWMPWDPAQDALAVAARMVSDKGFPDEVAKVGALFGWGPRRLNPALAYLCQRGLIKTTSVLGSVNWLAYWVEPTSATRRFVKSRQ